MKRKVVVALSAVLVSSSLYADSWLKGSVIEVKDEQKTIVVDTIYSGPVEVKILPDTKIKLDDCGWFKERGKFVDIKVGTFVKVDGNYASYAIPASYSASQSAQSQAASSQSAVPQNMAIATKVKVKCNPTKAY